MANNMVPLPEWMSSERHVQLHRRYKDDTTPIICGYVVNTYPLGITIRPCENHLQDKPVFVLWTAIQEIHPQE